MTVTDFMREVPQSPTVNFPEHWRREKLRLPDKLFTCTCCRRGREVWRARDFRAIYAHLCTSCYQNLPVSHLQHYVSVEAPGR